MTGARSNACGHTDRMRHSFEAADPINLPSLLWKAWDRLAVPGWADADRSARFMRCIKVEAFESAATMLFDVNSRFRSSHSTDELSLFQCEAVTAAPSCLHVHAKGWTEAFARTACAVRVRAQQEEGR